MATAATSPITFNRVASPALERALSAGGDLAWLLGDLKEARPLVDIQLRADGKGASWITAYVGLTKVLDVIEVGGQFRLYVHDTHAKKSAFDTAWSKAQSISSLTADRAVIEAYLASILSIGQIDARYTGREGRVQSLISNAAHADFGVVQREAVAAFASVAVRESLTAPLRQRMWAAVARQPDSPAWWPTVRNHEDAAPRLGLEADLLGWDDAGRLLVIEVKPADAVEGIAWAPAQARMYAEVFAHWLDVDPQARSGLIEMSKQRLRLGLSGPSWQLPTQQSIRVVPVIAIGSGNRSAHALPRLAGVHAALQTAPPLSDRLDPLEVWLVDDDGQRTSRWRPDQDEVRL